VWTDLQACCHSVETGHPAWTGLQASCHSEGGLNQPAHYLHRVYWFLDVSERWPAFCADLLSSRWSKQGFDCRVSFDTVARVWIMKYSLCKDE
jgi:hypothetical protein